MDTLARLNTIMEQLTEEAQLELLEFAGRLLEAGQDAGQQARPRFYICPVCFEAAPESVECHGHQMIPCLVDRPEDRRPIADTEGNFTSPAPRWFVRTVFQEFYGLSPADH
jgi:hypothetical protein